MLKKLTALLTNEPALVAWVLNGGLATLLAFVLHLSAGQTAAIAMVTTALASVYTALRARPVAVPLLTGAMSALMTACEAFGLHLPASWVAAGVAGLSAVLGLVLRENLTPTTKTVPHVATYNTGYVGTNAVSVTHSAPITWSYTGTTEQGTTKQGETS